MFDTIHVQTFSSIVPYTIEEAYEVADAVESGDMDMLKDELADLLLQVVFHARMAEEAGAGVTMFQMVEIKHANTAYMIRVAVLTNGSAIGLDFMDMENGQFFIPETCPVIPLEVPTIN